MASCYIFIHMNVKEVETKNSFDEVLGLGFDLKHLKVNAYYIQRIHFCKGLSK